MTTAHNASDDGNDDDDANVDSEHGSFSFTIRNAQLRNYIWSIQCIEYDGIIIVAQCIAVSIRKSFHK